MKMNHDKVKFSLHYTHTFVIAMKTTQSHLIRRKYNLRISHCFGWRYDWQTLINSSLCLKLGLRYLQRGTDAFIPHKWEIFSLLHYPSTAHLLLSWHIDVSQENVYTSKPLKCQAPWWAQTRSVFMINLWTVHFFALILAVKTSFKELIADPFETSFSLLLFQYWSMDVWTICILKTWTVHYVIYALYYHSFDVY